MTITNFPMVSQRSTVTSDGRPSENALFDCVPASIGAVMLWLEGKSAWDDTISPDKLKDAAYGEAYSNAGTDAARYVDICKNMGFTLSRIDKPDPVQTVALARDLLHQNTPAIFTEIDPYVDTNLPQYSGWTHVCVWIGDDAGGLTAMDPFIAQPVYKSDGTWASLLRANQVWTVEKIMSLPRGWTDDGTTLRGPNGVPFVLGFRAHVKPRLESGAWEADDEAEKPQVYMPRLEASNADLGDGDQIVTKKHVLGYPHNPKNAVAHLKNTVIEEYVGTELAYTRQQYSAIFADRQLKMQQIAQLQAEIDQLKAQPAQPPASDPRIADYTNRLGQIHTLSSL